MKKIKQHHHPFFHIYIMNSHKPHNKHAIKEIKHYNPIIQNKSNHVNLKLDHIDY